MRPVGGPRCEVELLVSLALYLHFSDVVVRPQAAVVPPAPLPLVPVSRSPGFTPHFGALGVQFVPGSRALAT